MYILHRGRGSDVWLSEGVSRIKTGGVGHEVRGIKG